MSTSRMYSSIFRKFLILYPFTAALLPSSTPKITFRSILSLSILRWKQLGFCPDHSRPYFIFPLITSHDTLTTPFGNDYISLRNPKTYILTVTSISYCFLSNLLFFSSLDEVYRSCTLFHEVIRRTAVELSRRWRCRGSLCSIFTGF